MVAEMREALVKWEALVKGALQGGITMIQLAIVASAAFNLVCTGNVVFGQDFKTLHPFETVLRIDLQSNRWCKNDCISTAPFFSVTDTVIVFQDDNKGECCTSEGVNRESGKYMLRIRPDTQSWALVTQIGSCVRAAFTGFPARKF
jgi:hypothetical protein